MGLAQKATYVTPKPTTLENTDVVNFFNSVPKFIEGFVGGQTRYLHNLRFRRAIEDRNPKAVGKVYQRLTQPITINLVKKVAHRYNVRVPAVLMAMVGQNLTKIFEKSEKVPKTAYASYGVPMPNHPGRLTNHVKVGMMTISLSKQNIVVRMKELNEAFLKLKDDPTTNVILYLGSVFGSLFPPMTKFFLKHSAYVPFSITNFVVESEGFSIGGRECIRFTGGCGPHEDISDALITILGYKIT
ncbi:hypothetical protein Ocin01_19292 [Orchesella cincta]|uniref:O-acyltransferase WSD1 C-terminal domain-containing protein n=1 Tax=Orchesella cincta TaxID=48709 RepID=A0A1D2M344_ORCCI|nr:hypothetical protein Ocin01_19292 [Orchesella cincta]